MPQSKSIIRLIGLCACLWAWHAVVVQAQSSVITYQGHLADNGQPANGAYDLRFILYDMLIGGAQQGPIVMLEDVTVANGNFTVQLDFGAVSFPGAARWLEISVRPGASVGLFTVLTPRQSVAATPYAIRSLSAANADAAANAMNATNATTAVNFSGALGGDVTGNQGATTVGRLRNIPLPTPAQSDDGRVLRYQNDGVNPPSFVLAADANSGGTITGVTAGAGLSGGGTSGTVNIAIGASGVGTAQLADQGVTTAKLADSNVTTAKLTNGSVTTAKLADGNVTDAKIATVAGGKITGTIPVAAVPAGSGSYVQNTTSPQTGTNFNISGNGTAGGTLAGNVVSATTQYNLGGNRILSNAGLFNLFMGVNAGPANTGNSNAFFGFGAGNANTTGDDNAFFGTSAGANNTIGFNNAFFGRSAGNANTEGDNNAFFGTSAGANNTMGGSNAFFGGSAGFNNSTGTFNAFFGATAGANNTMGNFNAFFGTSAGAFNTTGHNNAFFGIDAGLNNTTGFNNAFFGANAGDANTTGSRNTLLGAQAGVGSGNLTYATAIGSEAIVTSSARIQLGRDGVDTVRVGELAAATATHVCISANNVLASCSSSQRYKQNVHPWHSGLKLIQRLRPVRFDWKEQRATDLGLIAEEVAKVEPLLVTHNKAGVIEGVKYDQLSVVLINAVKEQQAQIAAQQKQIEELQKLVCRTQRRAKACQPAQR
jgi:hypothetical protein